MVIQKCKVKLSYLKYFLLRECPPSSEFLDPFSGSKFYRCERDVLIAKEPIGFATVALFFYQKFQWAFLYLYHLLD